MAVTTSAPAGSAGRGQALEPLPVVAVTASATTAVIAGTVLAGWAVGVEGLTTWGAQQPTVPGTAVAVLLLALGTTMPRVARYPATVAGLVGLRAGLLYVLDVDVPLGWLDGAGSDGMALLTAASLVVLSTALVLGVHHRRSTEAACALVLPIAIVTLLGYLYGFSAFYAVGPAGSIMAPPTAAMLVLLCIALLARVPHGAATWLVHGRDAGAVLLRRQLPIVLLVVPFAGYVVTLGGRREWYDTAVGTAVLACVAMVLLGATAFYTAALLTRTDERRQRAMTALSWINADLTQRIEERAEELDAARSRSEVFEDRQRIAADMHDHVIQVLFAVALKLNGAIGSSKQTESMHDAVSGIDEAIKELRASIYELKNPVTSGNLATRLERIVESVGRSHTHLSLAFTGEGSLDWVSDTTAEQLVAAARELVSNAVRHAQATTVTVELEVDVGGLTLTVSDDGRGMDPGLTSTSGMRNVRRRAEDLGGTCTWAPRDGGGTVATWRAACRPPTRSQGLANPAPEPTAGLDLPLADALLVCARALATAPAESALDEVAAVTAALLEADHVSVGLAAPDEQMRLILATGMPRGADAVGLLAPRESTLSGYVMTTGEPLKVRDLSDLPASLRLFGKLPFGPGLMVPVGEPPFATFVVARSHGRPPFTHEDMARAVVLSRYVALVLDLTGRRPSLETLAPPSSMRAPATAHALPGQGAGTTDARLSGRVP